MRNPSGLFYRFLPSRIRRKYECGGVIFICAVHKTKSNECMKITSLKGSQGTMQYAVLQGTLQSMCRAVNFAKPFDANTYV